MVTDAPAPLGDGASVVTIVHPFKAGWKNGIDSVNNRYMNMKAFEHQLECITYSLASVDTHTFWDWIDSLTLWPLGNTNIINECVLQQLARQAPAAEDAAGACLACYVVIGIWSCYPPNGNYTENSTQASEFQSSLITHIFVARPQWVNEFVLYI